MRLILSVLLMSAVMFGSAYSVASKTPNHAIDRQAAVMTAAGI